jgi:hypothetical protein
MDGLRVELTESQDDVPFNAQVKSYFGAKDDDGHPWILKPAASPEEVLYHRMCAMVYLMDHETGTLAAPTTVFHVGGKPYAHEGGAQRHADFLLRLPAGSFIDILRADLVNRWIYCDEDRNPNNYLVINNSQTRPFVAAHRLRQGGSHDRGDENNGKPGKFGWHRLEKTRSSPFCARKTSTAYALRPSSPGWRPWPPSPNRV